MMQISLRTLRVAMVVIAATSISLLAACAKHEDPPPPVRPVQLVQVKGADGATSVFSGEVKPRHESDLAFRIAGKVVVRNVDMGSRVKKGDALARLDPADVGLQAEAQRAALAAAETEYAFARDEFDRYSHLYEQKFVSASALDQKRNTRDANRAKWEQEKAQLAVTQNQASYATLVAAEDGVITSVSVDVGQVVAAGQVVMRLARENEREVAIAVPESRIGELDHDAQLAIVLWSDRDKAFPARVREIAPAVDPVTRTFAVRVSLLATDVAPPWGTTANVVVRHASSVAGVLVPLPSIYQQEGRPAVWVYDATTGTVALRPIAIEAYREDGVVVSAGLKTGEWIVAAGVHKLTPNQLVRPYEDGIEASAVRPPNAARAAPTLRSADGRGRA